MTFEEHWNKVLAGNPALSSTFARPLAEAAWQEAFRDGYEKGVSAFHEAVTMEREECAVLAEGATAYTQFQTVEHYKIAAAIAAGIRMRSNDRVEGRDAASSRRVPSHDGLGQEVAGK